MTNNAKRLWPRLRQDYVDRLGNISYNVREYEEEDGTVTIFKKPRALDDREANFIPNGFRRLFENNNNVIYDVIECCYGGNILVIKKIKAFEDTPSAGPNNRM
ncbi:unnamed protein product [Clavelina lepadiformis]|uniref:Uncharacterized protein n=1 Tax=Clavelina lepadiformis TaxID=159417 RepID=A0ABP0GVU5_CLALP